MAAWITAVRGRPAASDQIGVAWVSTTLPVPSPSTMRMTTVRDRRGFTQAHRAGPLITYLMRYAAARLWRDDLAYAERRYQLRAGEPTP